MSDEFWTGYLVGVVVFGVGSFFVGLFWKRRKW